MEIGDDNIKTFALRGVKDNPPYLHDGRLLTLDDTVEFFNLILADKRPSFSQRATAETIAHLNRRPEIPCRSGRPFPRQRVAYLPAAFPAMVIIHSHVPASDSGCCHQGASIERICSRTKSVPSNECRRAADRLCSPLGRGTNG
jgi:hypothetical protein